MILGTAALTDPELLREALAAHGPERVLVSVDARGGTSPRTAGSRATDMPAPRRSRRCAHDGVREFVFTNIDRDGMLDGPDLDEVASVAGSGRGRQPDLLRRHRPLEDLRALAGLRAELALERSPA